MSKKTFGVVITTEKGVKIMGMFQKTYPNRGEIKDCLRFELAQELEAIQTRNSGWRLAQDINKEIAKVNAEYKASVKAINNNNFKIKVLA